MESKTELTCDRCGTAFMRRTAEVKSLVKRGITRKFCSSACRNANDSAAISIDIAAEYLAGKSMTEVGLLAGVSWSLIRKRLLAAGVVLRSPTSHLSTWKNPTKGNGHTEATKDKLRALHVIQFSTDEARALASHNQAKAMAEGRVSKISKTEDRVAAALDVLGIQYKRQVGLRKHGSGRFAACLDFMLADGTALEVNGSYWHSDPRVYPNGPTTASQKHTAVLYAAKQRLLAERGIRLREIWEMDINADLSAALAIALG